MPSGPDYVAFLLGQRQTRAFTSEPVSDEDIHSLLFRFPSDTVQISAIESMSPGSEGHPWTPAQGRRLPR